MITAYFGEHTFAKPPGAEFFMMQKTDPETVFPDRIGGFFRTYNFMYYKGGNDDLKPEDLFFLFSRVFSFKAQHEDVQFEDCTLTVFCPPGLTEVLRFLEDSGFTAHSGEDPSILYVDLFQCIKMQIVVSGAMVGESNEYAPLNVLTDKLDEEHVLNLIRYRETYISPDDAERLELYNTLLNDLYTREPDTMLEIIRHIKETNRMSQEQLCTALFPEVLAARDEAVLNGILLVARNAALRHGYSFEDALLDIQLPAGCSREEALRRMHTM